MCEMNLLHSQAFVDNDILTCKSTQLFLFWTCKGSPTLLLQGTGARMFLWMKFGTCRKCIEQVMTKVGCPLSFLKVLYYQNRLLVSGWSPIGCECSRTNVAYQDSRPLLTALVDAESCRFLKNPGRCVSSFCDVRKPTCQDGSISLHNLSVIQHAINCCKDVPCDHFEEKNTFS